MTSFIHLELSHGCHARHLISFFTNASIRFIHRLATTTRAIPMQHINYIHHLLLCKYQYRASKFCARIRIGFPLAWHIYAIRLNADIVIIRTFFCIFFRNDISCFGFSLEGIPSCRVLLNTLDECLHIFLSPVLAFFSFFHLGNLASVLFLLAYLLLGFFWFEGILVLCATLSCILPLGISIQATSRPFIRTSNAPIQLLASTGPCHSRATLHSPWILDLPSAWLDQLLDA